LNRKRLIVFLVLTALVTGFIFHNSLQNSQDSNEASDVIEEVVEPIIEAVVGKDVVDVNYVVRKGAHLTEFFALGVIVSFVILELRKAGKYFFGYGLFYVLAVGVFDEYIQSFSDRTSLVADILIDFFGAAIGFAVIFIGAYLITARKIRKNRSQKGKDNGDKN